MWEVLEHVGVSKSTFGQKGSDKWLRVSITDPYNVRSLVYE